MMSYSPIVYLPSLADERAQAYQHRWFLCDTQHRLIPAEQLTALNEVGLSLFAGCLRISAPGMLTLELLLDVIEDDDSVRCQAQVGEQLVAAIDEGELAHTWFSQLLGQPCLCLKVDPESEQSIVWP